MLRDRRGPSWWWWWWFCECGWPPVGRQGLWQLLPSSSWSSRGASTLFGGRESMQGRATQWMLSAHRLRQPSAECPPRPCSRVGSEQACRRASESDTYSRRSQRAWGMSSWHELRRPRSRRMSSSLAPLRNVALGRLPFWHTGRLLSKRARMLDDRSKRFRPPPPPTRPAPSPPSSSLPLPLPALPLPRTRPRSSTPTPSPSPAAPRSTTRR